MSVFGWGVKFGVLSIPPSIGNGVNITQTSCKSMGSFSQELMRLKAEFRLRQSSFRVVGVQFSENA